LNKTISKFPIDGSKKVEKPVYKLGENNLSVETGYIPSLQKGKIYINILQFFDNVKEEVWQYQIGGYQVCEKWLKDRKTRTLTLDEIKTYCKIVTAISETIDLQIEIDK
jgi:Type ISP C-terminal specificity domain